MKKINIVFGLLFLCALPVMAGKKALLTGKALPSDGDISAIIFYRNGVETGRETRTAQNVQQAHYAGSIPDGVYKVPRSSGTASGYELVCIAKGKRNGLSKGFFSNGKTSGECFFRDGLSSGICKSWHEDGSPAFIAVYKNGVQDGKARVYYPDGKPLSVQNFKAGHPIGEALEYYPTGKLKSRRKYSKDGKPVSTEIFAKDGKLIKPAKKFSSPDLAPRALVAGK